MPFMNDSNCPLLDYIKSGQKTVEGRINNERYQQINADDIIIFKTKNEDDVFVKVTFVHKYKTLEDYLEKETIEKTLPCVKSISEGVSIYNKWSTKETRDELVKKFGFSFLGIGIQIITKEEFDTARKYLKYKTKYMRMRAINTTL